VRAGAYVHTKVVNVVLELYGGKVWKFVVDELLELFETLLEEAKTLCFGRVEVEVGGL
jgi:hypothetical protein